MKRILFLIIPALFLAFTGSSLAQNTDSACRKGIASASEGRFQEALSWFKEGLKDKKSEATAHSCLAVIEDLNNGKIDQAYAKSFFAGLNLIQNGKTEDGLKEFEGIIELNPDYPRAYNVAGMIYASLAEKAKSIAYFQKAIAIDPQYSQAYFNLALLYQSLSQPLDALKYYEKAASLDPDSADTITNLAALYASLGRYSEAIKYYQKATDLDKDNPEIYYNLALVYFMSDQLIKFRDNLLKAQGLYQRNNDTQGLEKVAEYMKKIKEIENKVRHAD